MDGTNALLISPIGAIQYSYGPQSFRTHVKQAEEKGVAVKVCHLASFELDVDLPEDYEIMKSRSTIG